MSTGAIVAIVVGVVVVLALITLFARQRRLAGRREEARSLRDDARTHTVTAEAAQASAAEKAARAQRAEAEAEEKAAQARRERVSAEQRNSQAERELQGARDHHDKARAVDPDVSDSPEEEALDIDAERTTERA